MYYELWRAVAGVLALIPLLAAGWMIWDLRRWEDRFPNRRGDYWLSCARSGSPLPSRVAPIYGVPRQRAFERASELVVALERDGMWPEGADAQLLSLDTGRTWVLEEGEWVEEIRSVRW